MILPSDPLVVPQLGFRSDFLGWLDPIRSGIGFIDMGCSYPSRIYAVINANGYHTDY